MRGEREGEHVKTKVKVEESDCVGFHVEKEHHFI